MDKAFLLRHIGRYCKASQKTIAVAESCTGGLLAAALTQLAGSSSWFERGFVTYSNLSKQSLLAVSQTTLAQYGAVSPETAQAMAEGALKNSKAYLALSITGIAGPCGGSKEKPVGTVFFAIAAKNKTTGTYLKNFAGSRNKIRKAAVYFALSLLYETLCE